MTTGQKELPTGWKWVKLRELCNKETYKFHKLSDVDKLEVYGVSKVDGITKTQFFRSEDLSNYQLLNSHWFAYNPYRINIGSIGLCPKGLKGLVSPAYVVFSVDSQIILPSLILAYLKSDIGLHQIRKYSKGTVRQTLRFNDLCLIDFPLPPIEEQKRITGILNKAEEIKKLREEADKKTEELKTSLLFQELSSLNATPSKPLKDVSHNITKGTTPPKAAIVDMGIPFIRATDVVGEEINPDILELRVDEETNQKLARSQINGGEVLITIAGTLGRVAWVPFNNVQMNCNQAVAIIQIDKKLANHRYVAAVCSLPHLNQDLIKGGKGLALQNLNLQQISAFTIPLPSLASQNEIVRKLDGLSALRSHQSHANQSLDATASSLLQRAFRGEL